MWLRRWCSKVVQTFMCGINLAGHRSIKHRFTGFPRSYSSYWNMEQTQMRRTASVRLHCIWRWIMGKMRSRESARTRRKRPCPEQEWLYPIQHCFCQGKQGGDGTIPQACAGLNEGVFFRVSKYVLLTPLHVVIYLTTSSFVTVSRGKSISALIVSNIATIFN